MAIYEERHDGKKHATYGKRNSHVGYSLSGKNSMLLDNSRLTWNRIFLPSIAVRIASPGAPVNPRRLLDQVRRAMRRYHYFLHTERSYVDRIKHYVHFH